MASLILSTAGNAAFGPVGGFLGALAGSAIDNAAITALTPARIQPSRLASLKVQASQEGAPIPMIYGRFRVTGQVIWASQFREISKKRTVGGKGGQRVVEQTYSISFAIGLCEGPIDGLGRVWVNGEPLDLSTTNHRLYLGSETQLPDPLVEAMEGINDAPAFRGLAYIVFEDLALGAYGDRIPQLSFEVMATPKSDNTGGGRLRDLAQAVCLIPGAGEFVYATTPQRRVMSEGHEIGENLHVQTERSDFDVSLDNLARDFPSVTSVSLVVAWFGTDLRAGACQIVPKVEGTNKQTRPANWSVAGLTRSSATLVSQSGGKPAYGGTPDDQSVIEGILALKARGHRVTHNPFVMMDVPANNNLPNPYGGSSQGAYPWRGRITCSPAIGQPASADASAAATSQVNAFFGTVTASHFSVSGTRVKYTGPNQWSYRRFILHQAALCVAAGGVDTFLIGSELIGLTRVRGAQGDFPAVDALMALATEVRALIGPSVKITYGADWTEYGAYMAPGTNDLRFPLDALWASPNIDFIGLDWYAPLSDRRVGEMRCDVAKFQSGIEGGEAYDFYYANDAARIAKTRTPILDTAYQEHWVWRQKDIRAFWSNAHFERIGGVRDTTPTAWIARSKPMAFMELGFPAVDKGANRPSVFPDPKSIESGLPPFSNGIRDDVEQRLALEATLSYWRDHNPLSDVYSGTMMDMTRAHLWAWDARPFPYFPSMTDTWADGTYAMMGHWLAGRSGALSLSALISDICVRGGVSNADTIGISGYLEGFAIEGPISARSVLENVFTAFGLEAGETTGQLKITDGAAPISQFKLTSSQMVLANESSKSARAITYQSAPSAGQFTSFAIENDFQPAVHLTAMTGQNGPMKTLASPMVLDASSRKAIADRLARAPSSDTFSVALSPAISARLEVGDRISIDDGSVWRVDRLAGQYALNMQATRAPDQILIVPQYAVPQIPKAAVIISPPIVVILDVTAPFTDVVAPKPLVGCASKTWPGPIDVSIAGQVVGTVTRSMTIGCTVESLTAGPVGRIMGSPFLVSIYFDGELPHVGRAALMVDASVVDIISWRSAQLVAAGIWQLQGWVRGLGGAMEGPALNLGTQFVLLDDALVAVEFDPSLVGITLEWQASPQANINLTSKTLASFNRNALRPWPPCHVKAKRAGTSVNVSWVRRARGNGDAWAVAKVPLGAGQEAYQLSVVSASQTILRTIVTNGPTYEYDNAAEIADFLSPQSAVRLQICQIGDDGLLGEAWTGIVAIN